MTETYNGAPYTINTVEDALEAVRTKRIMHPGDGLRAHRIIKQLNGSAPQLLLALRAMIEITNCVSRPHHGAPTEHCDCYACCAVREAQSIIAAATKPIHDIF